jgi:hypothetical protein
MKTYKRSLKITNSSIEELKKQGFTAVEIPLTRGKWATIDIDDAEKVLPYRWNANLYENKKNWRAAACPRMTVRFYLHNFLLPDAEVVDHVNGNGLDNRRSNIRAATVTENRRNERYIRNPTGVKGIYRMDTKNERWCARIKINRKKIHLGSFATCEEAGKAYDEAAKKYFGEFAATNGSNS